MSEIYARAWKWLEWKNRPSNTDEYGAVLSPYSVVFYPVYLVCILRDATMSDYVNIKTMHVAYDD